MSNKKRDFLQLVWDSVTNEHLKSGIPSIQMNLFTHSDERSILVIYFSDIDKVSFSNALRSTNPSYIIDMRSNPRFDITGYSRKRAFTEFENIGAKYMDYIELLGTYKKDKDQLIDVIEHEFFDKLDGGSLAFILGKKEQDVTYEEELIHKLPKTNHKWSLSVVPETVNKSV